MRRRPRAGVRQALGHGVELEAAVEAPGVAGEVALGVLRADVMVGAGERRLDVAQGRVDPSKWNPLGRLRAAAGDHGIVRTAGPLDRGPAAQAVGDDVAAGGEVTLGKLLDLLLAETFDDRQPQPAWLAPGRRLDRRHERGLAGGTAAALAARACAAEIGVVDLDPTRELGLVGLARLHRRHQLLLHQPGGRLPGAQPPRQLDRRHPAFALAQVVDRQKPRGQRQLGPVEHRPGGQADLVLATVARVERPGLQLGAAAVAAGRAHPAFAPAEREQRSPALRLAAEPFTELRLAQPLHPSSQPTPRAHPTAPWMPQAPPILANTRVIITDNQVIFSVFGTSISEISNGMEMTLMARQCREPGTHAWRDRGRSS